MSRLTGRGGLAVAAGEVHWIWTASRHSVSAPESPTLNAGIAAKAPIRRLWDDETSTGPAL